MKKRSSRKLPYKVIAITAASVSLVWLIVLSVSLAGFYSLYQWQEKANNDTIYMNTVDIAQLKECHDRGVKPCTPEELQKSL